MSGRVMKRGPARFNMVGQKLPDSLHDMDETISPGLVRRLHAYAIRYMDNAGFDVAGWACDIYTIDGDLRRSERFYCVEFINRKGGMIGIQGIMTNRGHPCLDHGTSIDTGRAA